MATANDVIKRAFKTLDIFEAGEAPPAEDASDALDALNEMLHGWELEYGIDLGHSDLALTDTITLPDSHLRTVRLNLAVALAAEYETEIRGDVAVLATRGLRSLQDAYNDLPDMEFDRAFRSRTGRYTGDETFDG